MSKKSKFKEIDESSLVITYSDGVVITPDGRRRLKVKNQLATGEVNLGSCKRPNKKIIRFKYKVGGHSMSPIERFFRG